MAKLTATERLALLQESATRQHARIAATLAAAEVAAQNEQREAARHAHLSVLALALETTGISAYSLDELLPHFEALALMLQGEARGGSVIARETPESRGEMLDAVE